MLHCENYVCSLLQDPNFKSRIQTTIISERGIDNRVISLVQNNKHRKLLIETHTNLCPISNPREQSLNEFEMFHR